MRYAEAFDHLGYLLENPRQFWSASSEIGVCLSFWQVEIKTVNGVARLDTKTDCMPIDTWRNKAGGNRRHEHIKLALAKFDGSIDVVIVHGKPGEGYGDADPWDKKKRRARWKIDSFDENTGHFVASAHRLS